MYKIIPEIDMPGHAQAALAAYPEFGSIDGHPTLPVSAKWGVHSHLFNLEPSTFEFLQNGCSMRYCTCSLRVTCTSG